MKKGGKKQKKEEKEKIEEEEKKKKKKQRITETQTSRIIWPGKQFTLHETHYCSPSKKGHCRHRFQSANIQFALLQTDWNA